MNCRLVVEVELITATSVQPVVVAAMDAGRLAPKMLKVVTFPTAGLTAVTALTAALAAAPEELELEPQAERANMHIAKPAAQADLMKILGVI